MGCTASKSLEMQARREGWSPPPPLPISRSFIRSMSMPLRTHKPLRHPPPPAPPPAPPSEAPSSEEEIFHHVVALTSSTYGALKITPEMGDMGENRVIFREESVVVESEVKQGILLPCLPETEVIDLRELMRDLNETESRESKSQVLVGERRRGARALSRSISSVDSMRELDVKIRTVALALPDVETKLRALDALRSISRSQEEFSSDQTKALLKSILVDPSAPDKRNSKTVVLQSTRSMKGLFYGETLLPQKSPPVKLSNSGDKESESHPAALFDPEILKTFQTEIDVAPGSPDHSDTSTSSGSSPSSSRVEEQERLMDRFPVACPPKGEDRAVLYITSLRGIRKTYEDCNRVRMILQGFGIDIDERDVAMHSEFKLEMANLLSQVSSRNAGVKPAVPVPRLFIRGRYIGGAEEVVKADEEGVVEILVEGLTRRNTSEACQGCGGMRFVPCFECSGSCKKVVFGGKMNYSGSGMVVRCTDCNENGLMRCPVCL